MDTILSKQEVFAFMQVAQSLKLLSHDKHRKVAAVAVKNGDIIATGVNRFPRKIQVTLDRREKPFKYEYMLHAEEVLITNAGKNGRSLEGSAVILTWVPCLKCARLLIDSGVDTIFFCSDDMEKPKWEFDKALELLSEAQITLYTVDKDGNPRNEVSRA